MSFHETPEARQARIESVMPDIHALERTMDGLGELQGESAHVREAVRQACTAAGKGNYGIGAVLVHENAIVARGQNRLGEVDDPMHHALHAEMDALRDYHQRVRPQDRRHADLSMVTTLEPCPMCTCGMFNAGVRKAIAGSADPWTGQLISHPNAMPPLWLELLRQSGTEHRAANVIQPLRDACNRVFMITKDALDRALAED